MPASIDFLEEQALQLPPEVRVQLADRLLASLNSTAEVQETWTVEAERRLAELEGGSVAGLPVEESIARARSAIR